MPARVSLPHMHSDDRWPILKGQCPCIFTIQNSLYRGLLRIEACRTCIPMILAEILKSQPTCISTIKSHYKERHLRIRCTGCRIPIILRVAVSWWKSQGLGRKTDTNKKNKKRVDEKAKDWEVEPTHILKSQWTSIFCYIKSVYRGLLRNGFLLRAFEKENTLKRGGVLYRGLLRTGAMVKHPRAPPHHSSSLCHLCK